MTTQELYRLLDFPQKVINLLNNHAQNDLSWLTAEMKSLYYHRSTASDGLDAIKNNLGEDPDGLKLLWVLLEMARETYDDYERRGISKEIFAETMKFTTRFLNTHKQQHGTYAFIWAWWFWRELSMVEYRIGCLEYELVEENDHREISLHIPSDADMSPAAVQASMDAFRAFLAQQYPDWQNEPWVCDSWMMSPALHELLSEESNILAFQNRFKAVSTDEDGLGVLDWVFPPHKTVSDDLPETTSLQKRMKAWLLSGKKVGWTRAIMIK